MSTDNNYGSAANGLHAGSGYDCFVKRDPNPPLGVPCALACLVEVATKRERLCEIEIGEGADLQALAVRLAQRGLIASEDWSARGSEDYEALAERWDAIGPDLMDCFDVVDGDTGRIIPREDLT